MITSQNTPPFQCRTSTPCLAGRQALSVTLDGVFCYVGTKDKLTERLPSLRAIAKQSNAMGDCFVVPPRNDESLLTRNLFSILFILLLSLLPLVSFSQPDDSTKAYPLNDPRNPDCPCHKYQKLADEEYKKLLGIQRKVVVQNQLADKKDNSLSASNNTSGHNNYATHKYKRKKITKRHTKFRRMLCVKDWGILKRWKDPSKCFSWK